MVNCKFITNTFLDANNFGVVEKTFFFQKLTKKFCQKGSILF
jgi:hypothetical protein